MLLTQKEDLKKDEARIDAIESHCINMEATIKSLEHQIEQLANELNGKFWGKFPSDTKTNHTYCKVITLKSGKRILKN